MRRFRAVCEVRCQEGKELKAKWAGLGWQQPRLFHPRAPASSISPRRSLRDTDVVAFSRRWDGSLDRDHRDVVP